MQSSKKFKGGLALKENKFFSKYAVHVATACAVLALILFIPASVTKSSGLKVFFIVLMALSLIGGVVLLFLSNRAKGERLHYFLYDRRRGESVSKEELTFLLVREGMEAYLSDFAEAPSALLSDLPKQLRVQLESESDAAFAPLVAYRMFWELSAMEPEDIAAAFQSANPKVIGYLCAILRENADGEMADYIFNLKKNALREGTRVANFFRKNRRCFEDRMLHYVELHMSDFYMEKHRVSPK